MSAHPDFRHIRNWIFDLDNTLYPSSCDLFGQIDEKMALYTQRLLGITLAEARRLQKEYYFAHGTTLNGLMRVHGVDAEDYLAFVHDIDLSVLTPDPALYGALATLPGRKFVFTNGCINHARLTARAIEADGCRLAGWIANLIEPTMPLLEENVATLREYLPAPCLGVLPHRVAPADAAVLIDLSPLG